MGEWIIGLLQTDAVIAIVAGAFVTYIVKWLKRDGEAFKKYEGYAIAAVKAAEKAIPDDIQNKAARKLDYALRVFSEKYTKATGVTVDADLQSKIESWLSLVHDALEQAGTLKA